MLLPGKVPKPRTGRRGSHISCPSSLHAPAFLHWSALNLSVAAVEADTKKKGACLVQSRKRIQFWMLRRKNLGEEDVCIWGGRWCSPAPVHLLGRKMVWFSTCASTGEEEGVVQLLCICWGGRWCGSAPVHWLKRKMMWSSSCASAWEEDGMVQLLCIYLGGRWCDPLPVHWLGRKMVWFSSCASTVQVCIPRNQTDNFMKGSDVTAYL